MKGLVHIYEGTGKGKSTAGVGLTIRCAGNGFPVVYSQFLNCLLYTSPSPRDLY